jgi:hypothetical protein
MNRRRGNLRKAGRHTYGHHDKSLRRQPVLHGTKQKQAQCEMTAVLEQQELGPARLRISETETLGYPVGTAKKREDDRKPFKRILPTNREHYRKNRIEAYLNRQCPKLPADPRAFWIENGALQSQLNGLAKGSKPQPNR